MASRFGLRVLPQEQGPERIMAGAQMLYEMSERKRLERVAAERDDKQHQQVLDRMSHEAALNRQADEERFNRTREAALSDRARDLEMQGIVSSPIQSVDAIDTSLPQLDQPQRSWRDRAVEDLVGPAPQSNIRQSVGLVGGHATYDPARDLTRAQRLQQQEDEPNEFVVDGFRTSDSEVWEDLINTRAEANRRGAGLTANQEIINADRSTKRTLDEATGAAREWLRRGGSPEEVGAAIEKNYPGLSFGQRSQVLNDALEITGRGTRAEGGSPELREIADRIRQTQELARSQGQPLTSVELNQLIRNMGVGAAQADTVRALLRGERPR